MLEDKQEIQFKYVDLFVVKQDKFNGDAAEQNKRLLADWTLTNFSENGFTIKLDFSDPLEIS